MLLILVLIEVVVFNVFIGAKHAGEGEYVRGKFGSKCYHIGNEHKGIKYPIYYKALSDCLDSL